MIDDYDNIVLFVTGALVIALAIWNILIQKRLKDLNFLRDIFFKGTKARDLEDVIKDQSKNIVQLDDNIQKLNGRINSTKDIAEKGIQKLGIVRYDTFKNDGGNQSFSIAMLNKKNDGLILSGLNSREGGRFYTKPVEKSQSKYTLSDEEKKALNEAKTTP